MARTKVIFRMFEGDVVAFFPELPAGMHPWQVESYVHVGQHGAATRAFYDETEPASEGDYIDLYEELEEIGYNLHVVKRWTYQMDRTRDAEWREMMASIRDAQSGGE